jgi:hypothetical protein
MLRVLPAIGREGPSDVHLLGREAAALVAADVSRISAIGLDAFALAHATFDCSLGVLDPLARNRPVCIGVSNKGANGPTGEITMNWKAGIAAGAALFSLVGSALAELVPKGTPVQLIFDQSLSSKTAHAGDRVRFHVGEDVTVNGHVIIKSGTRVTATVDKVNKRGRFGKNAELKLMIDPVRSHGTMIPLQPRQKGNMIGGTRGTTAAAAAGGGALVLGPLGLAAGYFVVGKAVNVHPGQKLETQVSEDVNVK